MTKIQEKYALNAENIDRASENFFAVCQELKMDRKESIKQRLAFENALMTWLSSFDEEHEFEIIVYTKLFTPHVALRCVDGKAINPLIIEEDLYSNSILSILSNAPEYYYNNGINTVIFKLKKPSMHPMLALALVILISVVIGVLGKLLLPENIVSGMLTYFIDPIYSKFLGVLGCIAGPLIFLSVAWGIYGIGDVATFNKIGKSLMGFLVFCATAASFLAIAFFPVFSINLSGSGTDISQLLSILQLFLDMIPTNIVNPFVQGNTIQIIVLAVVVGIALLYLGKRSESIARGINQLNNIINFALSAIGTLVPAFIALTMINIIWSGKISIGIKMWKVAVIQLISFVLICAVFLIITAINTKTKPDTILKKILQPTLIAFSTASSSSAFGDLVNTCKDKLGINKSLVEFGVPLCIVTQKTIVSISYALVALYVAGQEGISISFGWLVLAALVSAVTAIATPPIPGGTSIAYTMLFTQLGLPTENIGVILALDMIMDFAITGANVFCSPLALLNVANKYGLINKDVLNSK